MDSFCDIILETLEHRLIELRCPTDIVRFSFVVQNSISSLDLAQQDPLNFRQREELYGFSNSSCLHGTTEYPKLSINTEEKCRKILSRARNFLYRLHLDLPKMREPSLKNGPEPKNMLGSLSRHIGKITVHPGFYFSILSCLVKEAVHRSDQKLKLIKWLVTFRDVTEDAFLNSQHVNYFVECLYTEARHTEPALMKAFLKRIYLCLWIDKSERSEYLEYILFHFRKHRGTLNGKNAFDQELIDICIIYKRFLKVGSVLKYQDSPQLPPKDTVRQTYAFSLEGEEHSRDVISEVQKQMSPRFYFLAQILFIYFNRRTAAAEECLRVLWQSIPDAYFSLDEIETVLRIGLSSEDIQELYNFYSGAVGVYHARVEPRSLKDICRPTVRQMLWDSGCGCWIPDGIRQTGVPRELESFLNLED